MFLAPLIEVNPVTNVRKNFFHHKILVNFQIKATNCNGKMKK